MGESVNEEKDANDVKTSYHATFDYNIKMPNERHYNHLFHAIIYSGCVMEKSFLLVRRFLRSFAYTRFAFHSFHLAFVLFHPMF